MTLSELQRARPRMARMHLMAIEQGLAPKEIARIYKTNPKTVAGLLARAKDLLRPGAKIRIGNLTAAETKALDDKLTRHGRCKCGLLANASGMCGACTPRSAAELGDSRPGAGATYPGVPL